MLPQGTQIINLSQYDAMKKTIASASSCEELQNIATEILESLNAENAAITAQMDNLAPILALLDAPASIDDVIDWITGLITHVLTPLAAPAITYPLQITARTAAITDLVAEITKRAGQFESCSISLP